MKVQYRQAFLKDLKQIKSSPSYPQIYELAFGTLTSSESLASLTNVKAIRGHPNRYRIRVGDYRIGIKVKGDVIELMRVLHRREFYRYFP